MDAYIELQSFILNDFLSSYYSKIPLLSKEETIRKLLRDHFISNDCIMQQLWECLRLQNKHDIARFIVSNLPKLPIGCRTHMAFELINFYVIWINSPKQSESNKLIVSSKFTSSLISSWKQSKLTPTDLYMEISSALTKGIVDLNEAENLLNWILLQGAHTPNFSWKMFESTKRCTFSTNCFDTVSIQRAYLSLDGHSCELLSFNKARLILSRDHTMKQQNLKSHQLPISLESPTTGNNLWWSRSTSSVQLSILLPTDTTNRPILLIGESLHYKFGILNIHNIICVDTIDNCCDDFNTIPFAILVQGNFMTNMQGLDVSSRGKSDGRSQCGDSRNESDNDAISDSDDEHLSRKKMPPATSQFRRRYYIIFGIVHVFSQNINVERVMSIQEDIFLDQHPTNLLYQEKNIAIIYGTNALLGMINLNYPPSKSCIEKMLLDENSKKEQALSTDEALNNCPQFQMLTNDTELPLSLNAVLSHANDAMITAIEYKPSSAILCSGDDHGVLCLWRLNFTSKLSSSPSESKSLSNQPLLTLPIRLGTRIYSLALSSTGHLIAVGLWNQLLLITYSENILYVKASLDIVPGFRALYLCHFGQSNTLTIWRIMNSSSKGDYATNSNYTHNRLGLSITTWLHHNLQEFDSGLDALIQSDELVSNNVDNPIVLQNLGYLPSKAEIISQPARELILPQLTSLTDLIKIKMFRQQNLAFLPQQENLSDRAISDVRSRAWSAQSDCFSVYSNASTVFQENDIQGIQNDVISVEDFMEPKADLSIDILNVSFRRELISRFSHGSNVLYKHKISLILAIVLAAQQAPSLELISTSLDLELSTIRELLNQYLHGILDVTTTNDNTQAVIVLEDKKMVLNYLVQPNGDEFAIDIAIGHNYLCALYLKYCGNKSVAIEHPWQEYLRSFGCFHLRKSSRMLRRLTRQIRKIDETANIRGTIPRQLGYVVGLQEIYARRVGLYGKLPSELGELLQLRVLSMGNNQLSGELPESFMNLTHLQRIVLHQNKLTGIIPSYLNQLGCIVNLAGNSGLEQGPDVPDIERQALMDIFHSTRGIKWHIKTFWGTSEGVCKWYKVGVLSSHVHSIVMSSNGMDGKIPSAIGKLTYLRMIELATMPDLRGPIPKALCTLTTLRRLCICRCDLSGKIPDEIGQLVNLEELQLFGNKLVGSVPQSLGNLINLKLLSLGEYTGGNDFSPEPLPYCLSSLVKLEALFMANCNVTSVLPSWLCELRELRQLDLQRNRLCGEIPDSIGQLENLLYLNLKDNPSLGGPLPIVQLCELKRLNRLSLVQCSFEQPEEAHQLLQQSLSKCKIWI